MLKKIARHRFVAALSAISLAFVLGGAIWTYAVLSPQGGGPFILHFNDIAGITLVGGLGQFIFMGAIGTVVVLMNFFIALELEERDRVLGKITTAATLVFAVLLFIAFAAILNVNV